MGSTADSKENPVVRAIPKLRKWFPNLVIACDVCLCPYTSHGHCGIIVNNVIDNDLRYKGRDDDPPSYFTESLFPHFHEKYQAPGRNFSIIRQSRYAQLVPHELIHNVKLFQSTLVGAHIIAPSDMMDNRIFAIKQILIENKLEKQVSLLSYAVKFASCFYGPFRDAAKSAPGSGDRKGYQLPPGSRGMAARAAVSSI